MDILLRYGKLPSKHNDDVLFTLLSTPKEGRKFIACKQLWTMTFPCCKNAVDSHFRDANLRRHPAQTSPWQIGCSIQLHRTLFKPRPQVRAICHREAHDVGGLFRLSPQSVPARMRHSWLSNPSIHFFSNRQSRQINFALAYNFDILNFIIYPYYP